MNWRKRSPHDWGLYDGRVLVASVTRTLSRRWIWTRYNGLSVVAKGRTTSRVAAMLAAEGE